ncbi:unnamed protein product [Mytilus coruscus]|uniref:Uncharacterized protein n=1 Tax=Mytilus coruscus TaxID=42192 RepID=A0A6J8BQZ5_MYTCO|nr:unnamed protein product [Mytilus coruscus]
MSEEGIYSAFIFIKIAVQINHVEINQLPNQKQYDQKTDNITLTCKGNGNPQPTYVWFKDNNLLSNKSFYVIENVIRNNSGVENEENYYQTLSHDGITVNPEYASVIHTNNASVGEAGDNLVCNNGKEGNKNKSRNNALDRVVTYDEVNQQANLKYELSKTDKPVCTGNSGYDFSMECSMNDGASDRPVVYDEINQQTTLKY